MVQIGQLLKYLSALNPQSSPTRLTLYNFLNHFYRAEQPLTAPILNTFFSHALEYPHWQQNRSSLGRETQQLLENLMMNLEHASAHTFQMDMVRWPQDMQIVELENFQDFTEAVHHFLTQKFTQGEKFRLISDQQKRLLAVILNKDQSIQVRSFDRKMTIRQGQLEPLRLDMALHYNAKLELISDLPQKLELSPYTCAQFEIVQGEVVGSAVRGYLFQKYQDFRGGPLRNHAKLFYSIKRIEQFYIDRRSDPFYSELMESIERASNFLKMGVPEGLEQAPQVIAQAEAALEQVFVGDKLLSLLVRDLQNLWQNQKKTQSIPTNLL